MVTLLNLLWRQRSIRWHHIRNKLCTPCTSKRPFIGSSYRNRNCGFKKATQLFENTYLHTEVLLQFQTQWEDSAMLLASNKWSHKDITKKRKTQQDRQNEQKTTTEKNKDQLGLQEAPQLQDRQAFHFLKCP